jgi:hypothetical protein
MKTLIPLLLIPLLSCDCTCDKPTYKIVLSDKDKYRVIYKAPEGHDRSVIDRKFIKRVKYNL